MPAYFPCHEHRHRQTHRKGVPARTGSDECARIELPLHGERSVLVGKLLAARRNRGVVLCTASTIKSLQLKLLEKMDVLRDTRRKQHPSMEHAVRALVQVLGLF